MAKVEKASPASGHNVATLDRVATWQLATAGGFIAAPVVVLTAGSADSLIALYDGASASGKPLAVHSGNKTGPLPLANAAYATGLFAQVSGTTAPRLQIAYTGNAGIVI